MVRTCSNKAGIRLKKLGREYSLYLEVWLLYVL